jgi:hypothetical protein
MEYYIKVNCILTLYECLCKTYRHELLTRLSKNIVVRGSGKKGDKHVEIPSDVKDESIINQADYLSHHPCSEGDSN